MRLALGKKEFMCLVVLETGTDSLAEDLSVKLYDLECLIKAWFGCFLSAKIRCSSTFAASSLLFKCWKRVPGDAYDVETSVLDSLDFICEVLWEPTPYWRGVFEQWADLRTVYCSAHI